MNVTLRHLRAFVEVAHQGAFTRAAQALALSQPALTVVINQFETELGFKLFDRTTRRVRLTQEGERFLPTAEHLLDDFDQALEDLRAVSERRRGKVAIAALPSVAIQVLPAIVKDFSHRYPAVTVHLYDANASGVQQRVLDKQADFGIGSRWEDSADLAFEPLLEDAFGLVCRADHELAKSSRPLSWSALKGYPFLGLAADTGIRPLLNGLRNLPETIRRPQYEVSNIATLEGMLRAGLGITALPALAWPGGPKGGLVFRPLSRPVLHREISAITRAGRSLSPAAESLLAMIRKAMVQREGAKRAPT